MKSIFEILKVILPAIITGIFTFFITKYTYNKNRPLDKLEIAYNRVYYPIYRLIATNNNDINEIIQKSEIYLVKYDKYVDRSTKRLFIELCQCDKEAKKKSIFKNFKDNICNRSNYMRRRLGYLDPNFWQLYKSSNSNTKSLFRISIELCLLYIFIVLCGITQDIDAVNGVYIFSLTIFLCIIIIIVFEIVWCFLRTIYYKIRK